jgi:sulfide:quinone oxidoreductase
MGQHHHKILIVGGGTAGITVAARLARAGYAHDLAIIEPSSEHYYQPLWTLVAAGVFPLAASVRRTKDYIPDNVTWYQDSAAVISAENKTVELKSGRLITCDWMIVATGIELNWDFAKGAREAITKPNVGCIYDKSYVDKTREAINNARSGRMIFTFPPPPVKCAGAPQKIMYLADEVWRKRGVRDQMTIEYHSALAGIFGLEVFANILKSVVARKNIKTSFNRKLIEIRPEENKAIFSAVGTDEIVEELTYDFLHIVPTQRPPATVRESDLCPIDGPSKGWVDVDAYTLRHKRWPHVFSLGDSCDAPIAKTGAAIRKQAPVLVSHLVAAITGTESKQRYDGYSSCPLVTGFGKVVLAEFGYDNKLLPSFPLNPAKERRIMWWLKTIALPKLYWYLMLRGRA